MPNMLKRAVRFQALAGVVVAGGVSGQQAAQGVQPPSERNDYAEERAWLCRPGRADACAIDHAATVVAADGTLSIERWAADPDTPIDCFYVYPTVSTDTGPNSDMMPDAAEPNVVQEQFSRFASVCRPYAPLYRQVTLAAVLRGVDNTSMVSGIQYDDVRDAWNHYLQHDNAGRGVVLVGHSQGAYLLAELIRREIAGRPVQSRLVSALLIGATIPVPAAGGRTEAFEGIPLCTSASQTGCLIAYSSFRSTSPPPPRARFGRVTEPGWVAACTNPASLAGGSGELHAYLPTDLSNVRTGSPVAWVQPEKSIETRWVSVPGLLGSRCTSNEHARYLEVTVHGNPADPRTDDIGGDIGGRGVVLPAWGLHMIDVNLALGNLVEIARRQGAAWSASASQPQVGQESDRSSVSK